MAAQRFGEHNTTIMTIDRLQSLTDSQVADLMALMRELDAEIQVTEQMLKRAVEAPRTHFFAVMDGERIIGCASLCVFDSPTGRKAHVEDVVVLSAYRGQHLGKRLIEHIIGYARKELARLDVYLTSRPHRVAANEMYKSVGFHQKETNVYKMEIRS